MLVLSLKTAIVLELVTAFLWGSWFQVIKRIGNYPIAAFMIWLYIFSNAVVWGPMIFFQNIFVPEGIVTSLMSKQGLSIFCFVCGIPFGIGVQISLLLMGKLGLVLSVSVSATLGIFTGTLIPAFINGLPDGISIWHILITAFIFLAGTLLVQSGGSAYRKDHSGDTQKLPVDRRIYLLFLLNVVLGFGYTLGMTYGMRSVTNPDALPPMVCCGLICAGAFSGTIVFSAIRLHQTGEVNRFFHTPKKIILYGLISGICHFGGNVTHMMAAPLLSLSVAWPITTTSNVWTYFWGFVYGEFTGASHKVKGMLVCGVCLYLAGIIFLYYIFYTQ